MMGQTYQHKTVSIEVYRSSCGFYRGPKKLLARVTGFSIAAGCCIHLTIRTLAMAVNPDNVFLLATVWAAGMLSDVCFDFGHILLQCQNGATNVHKALPHRQSSTDKTIICS